MASESLTIRDYRREIIGELSEDRKTFSFPKIESINAHGARTEWRVIVKLFRDHAGKAAAAVPKEAFIEIDDKYFDNKPMPANIYGWIEVISKTGEKGKIRDVVGTIVREGKNKGRSNETNVFCQTLRDALSRHNKQLKKTALEQAKVGSTQRYPPMLAKLKKDLKKPIDYTRRVFVQRKYNGVRTVATLDKGPADSEFVITYGRRKLLYPGFAYIKQELLPVLKYYWEEGRELYLDGEIYKHGMALQDISGLARREDKPEDVHLDYVIYDCFVANEPKLTYGQRKALLDEIFENFDHFRNTILAETWEVHSEDEVDGLYRQFLDEGFEGAMVRIDEPYKYSYNEYHSSILLKMKPTFDAEYRIIGWETGEKGKAAEAVMIICETKEGKVFNVTPAMELPDRIALARKMAETDDQGVTYFDRAYKNTMLRVYYDEISKDGVPQRARTKMERLGVDIIQ